MVTSKKKKKRRRKEERSLRCRRFNNVLSRINIHLVSRYLRAIMAFHSQEFIYIKMYQDRKRDRKLIVNLLTSFPLKYSVLLFPFGNKKIPNLVFTEKTKEIRNYFRPKM